ncbi:NUDIX domain-containing protein [Vibrio parahaemolyticus]
MTDDLKKYVKCHIYNSKLGFLLLRRASHDTHGGVWESVGGGIEKEDACAATAAVREVLEESGINLSSKPMPQCVLPLIDSESKVKFEGHLFLAMVDDGVVVDLSENPDHDDYAWVKHEELPKFLGEGKQIDSWTMTQLAITSH